MQEQLTPKREQPKKRLKKAIIIAGLIIVAGILFISLEESCARTGAGNFSRADSSLSFCNYLMTPFKLNSDEEEDLINLFEYETADYYYFFRDQGMLINNSERALLYITYSEEVYPQVKSYVFDNNEFVEGVALEYGGYVFYVNQAYNDFRFSDDERNKLHSGDFVLNGYNDEKRVYVAMAISVSFTTPKAKRRDKTSLLYSDFGAYLKEYFNYFDFDASPRIDADAIKADFGVGTKYSLKGFLKII